MICVQSLLVASLLVNLFLFYKFKKLNNSIAFLKKENRSLSVYLERFSSINW
jgi:hypothetical protein